MVSTAPKEGIERVIVFSPPTNMTGRSNFPWLSV